MTIKRCQNCAFWSGPFTKDCRRRSPIVVDSKASKPYPQTHSSELVTRSVWPKTDASDFCGEWNPLAFVEAHERPTRDDPIGGTIDNRSSLRKASDLASGLRGSVAELRARLRRNAR